MSRLKSLDALSALLAGERPVDADWMAVLALANETFVTPALYAAALTTGTVSHFPDEVRTYLADVCARNRERNRRLFGQLHEALAILNRAGIEPTLIKGAAFWAMIGRPAEHDRLMADVDLVVEPDDEAVAIRALEDAGFTTYGRYGPPFHIAAELARAQDVGLVDLHRRPPGPEDLAHAAMKAPGQMLSLEWDGVRARVPSPAVQVFVLVLHDQYQDGGYWRGGFALRHLLEIAALTRSPAGVDWSVLRGLAQSRLIRNVTDAHLRAAQILCRALTPAATRRPWVRLQHARLRTQFGWPRLQPLLVQFSG